MTRLARGMVGHPGNFWLAVFAIMGALAGGWMGVGVMLAMFGPLYLIGAWERGRR